MQNSQSNHIDRYLACGKSYRVLRDAVGKAMIECKTKGLLEAEKVGHMLLTTILVGSGWPVFYFVFLLAVSLPVEIAGLLLLYSGLWCRHTFALLSHLCSSIGN